VFSFNAQKISNSGFSLQKLLLANFAAVTLFQERKDAFKEGGENIFLQRNLDNSSLNENISIGKINKINY